MWNKKKCVCIWCLASVCRQAGRQAIRQLGKHTSLCDLLTQRPWKCHVLVDREKANTHIAHTQQFIFHFCNFEGQWNFIFDSVCASVFFFLKCISGWQISHFDRKKQRHFLIASDNDIASTKQKTVKKKKKKKINTHWRMSERTKRMHEWTNKGLS